MEYFNENDTNLMLLYYQKQEIIINNYQEHKITLTEYLRLMNNMSVLFYCLIKRKFENENNKTK